MKRNIILLYVSILAGAVTASAGVLRSFRCDFNNGIPDGIILVDNDGLEPSVDVKTYGFEKGTPWTTVKLSDRHHQAAASTSWYSPAGTSDDWMILPAVEIGSADVRLSWSAKAHDAVLSDGYEVYISTTGTDIAGFDRSKPLFSCAAEKGDWQNHSVSLSEFAGKTVNIAFVNNSTDKALLYIDDIVIDEVKTLSVSRLLPGLLGLGEKLTLSGTIGNNGASGLKGVKVTVAVGEQTYSFVDENAVIAPGESFPVEIPTEFVSATPEIIACRISVEAGGESLTEETQLFTTRQNVLVEEGTGTWCQYCPSGAVAISKLKEKYPEGFIPVAVHVNDPMAVEGYSVYTGSAGYPICVANRMDRFRGHPRDMESYYTGAAAVAPKVAIFTSGKYDRESNQLSLSTEMSFAGSHSEAQFALQYIVVENDVHSNERGYEQKNAFSGGEQEMGGFEDLPDPVPASKMWYQEVARMLAGGNSGFESSIPSFIEKGVPVSYECSFALPENIMNPEKLRVIAVVFNRKTEEVLNSAYCEVSGLSGISTTVVSGSGISAIREGFSFRIAGMENIRSIELFDASGRKAGYAAGSDIIEFDSSLRGLYLLRVTGAELTETIKVII